jgi:hypothetical protein
MTVEIIPVFVFPRPSPNFIVGMNTVYSSRPVYTIPRVSSHDYDSLGQYSQISPLKSPLSSHPIVSISIYSSITRQTGQERVWVQ